MEEVFEKIEVDGSMCCDEIDFEYEFDAPRFCDFTRPETFMDAFEAEQWFDYATSYPPSPFLLKFNMENAGAMESENDIADDEEVSAVDDNNSTDLLEFCNHTAEDSLNGKMKPFSKLTQSISKISRFMMPTASHLAKQKNPTEVQSTHSHRRFPSQSSSIDIELTKRQKLEAGYLSKVARLKHQTLFRHKKLKEVDLADNNVVSKSRVTIPREPNLETASRAQKHRSKANAVPGGDTKSSSKTIKARPVNKKAGGVLNSNSVSNSETRNLQRTNSSDRSMQEKCRMVNKGSPDDKELGH
ncbi:hypothetical protein TanjilG_17695 [Lupinus angustifolius]|uniref:TPX2 central domain-containing protein n=1 Tax=Lupinus angustifolius TaxID=3871 RepID=A0A1J7HV79_LUPAN|nr:hypothetical protein TanjilG_17695 [Lupinus angustifolius]